MMRHLVLGWLMALAVLGGCLIGYQIVQMLTKP